jgi:hypothetical protein
VCLDVGACEKGERSRRHRVLRISDGPEGAVNLGVLFESVAKDGKGSRVEL